MMYNFWDMEHDREFFLILNQFLPFYIPPPPLTTQRIKILKKWRKKMIETSSFYTSVPSYDIWFLRYQLKQTDFLCHLGPFFALLRPPPNSPQRWKYQKIENPWRYHHFTQVCQKSWLYAVLFLRYGTWHM